MTALTGNKHQASDPQNSALPLLILIAILVAVVAAIRSYLCGCGFWQILWSYSQAGSVTLMVGLLFLWFVPD